MFNVGGGALHRAAQGGSKPMQHYFMKMSIIKSGKKAGKILPVFNALPMSMSVRLGACGFWGCKHAPWAPCGALEAAPPRFDHPVGLNFISMSIIR